MRHTETKSAPEENGDVRVQTICACLVQQMGTSAVNVFCRLGNGRAVSGLATRRNQLEKKEKKKEISAYTFSFFKFLFFITLTESCNLTGTSKMLYS